MSISNIHLTPFSFSISFFLSYHSSLLFVSLSRCKMSKHHFSKTNPMGYCRGLLLKDACGTAVCNSDPQSVLRGKASLSHSTLNPNLLVQWHVSSHYTNTNKKHFFQPSSGVGNLLLHPPHHALSIQSKVQKGKLLMLASYTTWYVLGSCSKI